MPTGVRTADTDLSFEAVVQLAGSSDMDADSSVVVVVAAGRAGAGGFPGSPGEARDPAAAGH